MMSDITKNNGDKIQKVKSIKFVLVGSEPSSIYPRKSADIERRKVLPNR
jgi:hypothetical protein